MLAIFAQGWNNPNNGPPPEFWIPFLVGMGIVLLVALVIAIFFFLTLSKALSRCHPRNRTMEPGMVWLNFIPLFNLVWQFITVNRVAESLNNEFYDRGWNRQGEDYGKSVGATYCIMNLLGWIPYCGMLFGIVGLVCFIIYWVKIANYSSQLVTHRDDYDDRYEDRDDDRYEDRDDRDDRDDARRRRDDDDRPWERR